MRWVIGALTAAGSILLAIGGGVFGSEAKLGSGLLFIGGLLTLGALWFGIRVQKGTGAATQEAIILSAEVVAAHDAIKFRQVEFDHKIEAATTQIAELSAELSAEKIASKQAADQQHLLRADVRRRAQYRKHMQLAYEDLHNVAASQPINSPLESLIEAMCDAAYQNIVSGLGCDDREAPGAGTSQFWTFSIFSREVAVDGSSDHMARRFARSSDRKEEKDRRIWHVGEGYTGAAWRDGNTIVVEDSGNPSEKQKFFVPDDKIDPQDDSRYISVVSVPIKLLHAGEFEVCGIITVTCDRPKCFLKDQSDPKAQNVAFLEQVERIIAVQIQLRHHMAKGLFKVGLP